MGDIDWNVVKHFTEAGYSFGEAQRATAVAATRRASELGILAFLEQKVVPWLDAVEPTIDDMDAAQVSDLFSKANACKDLVEKVQPPRTRPRRPGEDFPLLDAEILARKHALGARLDSVIAKALTRSRS